MSTGRPPGLAFRAAAALVEVYAAAGFKLIVFDFVFEGPEHIEPFRSALAAQFDLTLVTLWADPDVLRARKLLRGRGDQDAEERVGHRWELMRSNLPMLGHLIDAHGSADEVASEVQARLAN